MRAFDFDEWSALARRDPGAFEARRSHLLARELARAGECGTQARRLLGQFEAEAALRPAAERLPLAVRYLAASTAQLADWLGELQGALARADARRGAQAACRRR